MSTHTHTHMNMHTNAHTNAHRQRITVSVTADDIDLGQRCNSWQCPIARALWRATGRKWVVWEWTAHVLGQVDTRVELPTVAAKFVHAYDNAEVVAPFEFEMEMRRVA